jgi:PTS system nitrogen regulatory IIA component
MNTSPHIHVGPTIRTMRLAAGHSLRELARRIGVSPAYLSGVENERLPTPTHERLRDVAAALGVPARRLTALSERLSPDLIAFLEETPEAVRFLRIARARGVDYDALAEQVTREEPTSSRSRRLGERIDDSRVWCRLEVDSKEELLETMTRRLVRGCGDVDPSGAVQAVLAREREVSTGVGGGVALGHADVDGLTTCRMGIGTLAKPLPFEAIDDLPVKVVFLVLGPSRERLRVLARIAQLCVRPGLLDQLAETRSARALRRRLRQADAEEE